MNIFLDTSSLIKLYHAEQDSEILSSFINLNTIQTIFLSELSKLEFTSTIFKKVRTKELSDQEAKLIIDLFELDFDNYIFIKIDSKIILRAQLSINLYGSKGLRTLDSIQLATALSLKSECDKFISADKLLNEFFKNERLPILNEVT